MSLRRNLVWILVGALLVDIVVVGNQLLERNRAGKQFLVLIEPEREFDPWSVFHLRQEKDVRRIAENEKLRTPVPLGELYVGKLAHECGAPQQLMEFPYDAPSDVYVPMSVLNEEMLACLVNRARREKVAIDFRLGTEENLPHESSDALKAYYDGIE